MNSTREFFPEDGLSRFTTAIGFDRLQSQSISHSLSTLGISHSFTSIDLMGKNLEGNFATTPHNYLYLIKPDNYGQLISIMKSQASRNPMALHVVVTSIPSLAMLGLSTKNFPVDAIFLRINDLLEIINSETPHKFQQIRDIGDFFEVRDISKTQVTLLLLMAAGNTNAEIARTMVLTEKGVESAIKRLAIKLNCSREGERSQNLRILIVRSYAQLLGVL